MIHSLILVLAALVAMAAAPPALAEKPSAERPTYEVGDTWVINDNVYTLVRVEKDVYVFTSRGDRELHLTRDLVITKATVGGRTPWELSVAHAIPWPLEVGKWRRGRNTGPRGTAEVMTTVEAYEDVVVKAGRFKAFRITAQAFNEQGRPTRVLTVWYAPDVRRIVKSQNTGGQTLNFEVTLVDVRGPAVAQPLPATPPPATARAAAAPGVDRPGPAERPTFAPGDRWIVSGVAYELSRVDRDSYVFTASGGHEIRLTKDLAVMKVVRAGRTLYDLETAPRWPWPLAVGKFTQTRTFATSAPAGVPGRGNQPSASGDFQVTAHVEAFEDVVVPAGRFKAFKIAEDWARMTAGMQTVWWRNTVWYAPELRRIVKGESTATAMAFELTGTDERATSVASTPPSAAAPPAVAPPADTEAPKVAINYPAADTKVESDAIVILGLITDNVAVDRVQITVNGVEIAQPRDLALVGRGVPIRVPAALQAGANVIEITAADKAGNVSQVVRTVTRAGAAVAAAPPPPKVANRWAVVVGVGEYDNRTIPKLRFATRDAEAMYQFLTTQGGYPKENVLLLTDTTAQKPTLLNIKRALGDFLARRAGRDDMVLIYFAGHGAPEVDTGGIEADGLSKYLIPRDGDPESLYTTALPMDEIQRIFSRVAAERIVMLLDTCYSGNAGGRTFARASTRATGINDQFLERLTRSRGRVIITASGPNEVALELPELGHGVFTYFVLEGLKGKADRNNDGMVTVSELYEYVEDQVDRTARRAGGRQRPLMKGEIEGTLPLAKTR